MVCEKCGNKLGFAHGTCIECGFNYIDGNYKFINVCVDDLPEDIKRRLIEEHNNCIIRNR